MKPVLFICSEWGAGMVPFASKIINLVAEVHGEVYTYTIAKDETLYKSNLNLSKISKAYFDKPSSRKVINILNKFLPFRTIYLLRRIIKENNIQTIYFLTGEFSFCLLSFLLKGTKIYTLHDLFPHETIKKSIQERFFEKWMYRGSMSMAKNSDIITTCSQYQYELLKKIYKNKKINHHAFPSLITKKQIKGGMIVKETADISNYILFFGNIHLYKGVEILYNTYINTPSLHQKHPLVIAGSGNIYFNRNDNEENIIFINRFIDDAEIKDLFSKAACVVYPYTSATQSGVISLAYYFNTPILASDINYFKEHITDGETGILFENRSETDLQKKLTFMLQDCDLSKIKKAQTIYYDRIYSDASLQKELINILSSTGQ